MTVVRHLPAQINLYPYFPQLLSDGDEIWYRDFVRNALEHFWV